MKVYILIHIQTYSVLHLKLYSGLSLKNCIYSIPIRKLKQTTRNSRSLSLQRNKQPTTTAKTKVESTRPAAKKENKN